MDETDLLDSDRAIVDVLADGRATPRYLVEETAFTKQTVHNRLNVLVAAEHVEKITDGLYELVDDPREDSRPMDEQIAARSGAEVQDEIDQRRENEEWADLRERFKEHLAQRPPQKRIAKEAVMHTIELLREEGPLQTNEIQSRVYERLGENDYKNARGMWQSIQRYMGSVDESKSYGPIPGIIKIGHGEWNYSGDEALARQLEESNE